MCSIQSFHLIWNNAWQNFCTTSLILLQLAYLPVSSMIVMNLYIAYLCAEHMQEEKLFFWKGVDFLNHFNSKKKIITHKQKVKITETSLPCVKFHAQLYYLKDVITCGKIDFKRTKCINLLRLCIFTDIGPSIAKWTDWGTVWLRNKHLQIKSLGLVPIFCTLIMRQLWTYSGLTWFISSSSFDLCLLWLQFHTLFNTTGQVYLTSIWLLNDPSLMFYLLYSHIQHETSMLSNDILVNLHE